MLENQNEVRTNEPKALLGLFGRARKLAAMIPLLIMFLVVTVLVHVYRWF